MTFGHCVGGIDETTLFYSHSPTPKHQHAWMGRVPRSHPRNVYLRGRACLRAGWLRGCAVLRVFCSARSHHTTTQRSLTTSRPPPVVRREPLPVRTAEGCCSPGGDLIILEENAGEVLCAVSAIGRQNRVQHPGGAVHLVLKPHFGHAAVERAPISAKHGPHGAAR